MPIEIKANKWQLLYNLLHPDEPAQCQTYIPQPLAGDNHTIFIYIQYKFHEIPSTAYLVMTEDGINH